MSRVETLESLIPVVFDFLLTVLSFGWFLWSPLFVKAEQMRRRMMRLKDGMLVPVFESEGCVKLCVKVKLGMFVGVVKDDK